MKKVILATLALFFSANLFSQTCQDVSVQLSAVVQNSPPQITLNWVANSSATSHTVFRKLKTATTFGASIASLAGNATQYIDNNVSVGVSYEYKITRSIPSYVGYGYINSGIEIAVTENRGKLILVIDTTFITTLAPEIKRLQNDLEGDGWKIITHYVSRTAPVTSVKALIVADFNADVTNTKAVFLLGHVPVPYSGDLYPDGHPDHEGAWPADVYYADMNGTWTDNSINVTVATYPRHHNVPGDGKFDQTLIPSDAELQIGRVDLANMPAFTASEQQLLKNYLDKDHDYRNKIFTAIHQAVIDDNFGFFGNEAFAASGYKNFGPLVGPSNVTANDYFTVMANTSYLWSYGCGGGSYTSASGIGNTSNFATSNLQGVFTMLFGSYFGDWDAQDNFLRAPLAQGKTLTNVWSGRPHWTFNHMGLGENIGYDVRVSQNNSSLYYSNYGGRFVHAALMGDPTLRNDIVAPVSNVVATKVGNNCTISWTASPDAVLGYYIYRKNDTLTSYVRLNSSPITGNTYTDLCLGYPGTYTYMVRALVLQTSPSGTYYNLSGGISDTAWNNNYFAVNAAATYSQNNNVITFTNTSSNGISYSWNFGDLATSTQQSPVHSYSGNGNYTVTLIVFNGCFSDTLIIPIFINTGINELYNTLNVSVFPNPSSGKFLISFGYGNTNAEMKIYSVTGELVHQNKISGDKAELDLTNSPNGIYFLEITSEKGKSRQRIIIQK